MQKTSNHEFLQTIFEESIKDLNKEYPFFIPCHVLKKTLEKNIASALRKEMLDSVTNKIEETIATFSKGEEFVLEPVNYSLILTDTIILHLCDETWEEVLILAHKCGFEQKDWHDIPILTCNSESEEICPFSNRYYSILTELLSMHGCIEFYGGELWTREQEEGDNFIYSTFSIQIKQLESINIDPYRCRICFSIDQLKYFAECVDKTCVRKVFGDAIATIECLHIC
ncbi:MAG: hypothetical protein IKF83_04985 [Clostridia bacterium]|nr:hypothetical protein [Clostridia bacterium]